MVRKFFILFSILLLFLLDAGLAQSNQEDTMRANHLLIKTDILFPIGVMLEYKTKSTVSFQISGYYITRSLWKQEYEDIQLEGSYEFDADLRHYIRNHFIGIYVNFTHLQDNVSMYAPFKQVYYSFGPQYGYQKEWGKFNLEGLIGFGISQNIQHEGNTKFGLYYFDDDDYYSPFIDIRLSIGIGYRIF